MEKTEGTGTDTAKTGICLGAGVVIIMEVKSGNSPDA